MIQIVNLCKKYKQNIIIENFNYEFNPQYIYFLTQENGRGKTTFFKCLIRETDFRGQILDENLVYAYMPERINYPSFVTVINFLKMFLALECSFNEYIIDKYLDYFNIVKYKNTYVQNLSKGTKQKILIIKTILSNADVYLFDEPLAGLDAASRNIFIEFLDSLRKKNKLLIIATHYYHDYMLDDKKEVIL